MASIALSSGASNVFPVGTTVTAHVETAARAKQGHRVGKLGSAAGSGVVAANGSLTITGLAPFTPHLLSAVVAGERRFVQATSEA